MTEIEVRKEIFGRRIINGGFIRMNNVMKIAALFGELSSTTRTELLIS
jgi:hypothetical protein